MNLPHIIVTGEAGHGKDTIGAYLISKYGYVRTAFADPLKQEAVDSYAASARPVPISLMHDPLRKEDSMGDLALVHCSDPDFIKVAMAAFAAEDQHLHQVLASAWREQVRVSDEALDPVIAAILGAGFSAKMATDLKKNAVTLAAMMAEGHPIGNVGHDRPKDLIRGKAFAELERMSLPRSPRRICQVWGTEYRRGQSDTYWVDKAADFIASSNAPVIICDGRFANECDWGEANGLRRMHAVRPGHAQFGVKHASEQIPPPGPDTAVLINDRRDDNFASFNQQIEDALNVFLAEPRKISRHLLAA